MVDYQKKNNVFSNIKQVSLSHFQVGASSQTRKRKLGDKVFLLELVILSHVPHFKMKRRAATEEISSVLVQQ